MNWDKIAGNWKQYKGKIKETWSFLTDEELDRIGGNRDQLVGMVDRTGEPSAGPRGAGTC